MGWTLFQSRRQVCLPAIPGSTTQAQALAKLAHLQTFFNRDQDRAALLGTEDGLDALSEPPSDLPVCAPCLQNLHLPGSTHHAQALARLAPSQAFHRDRDRVALLGTDGLGPLSELLSGVHVCDCCLQCLHRPGSAYQAQTLATLAHSPYLCHRDQDWATLLGTECGGRSLRNAIGCACLRLLSAQQWQSCSWRIVVGS